MCVKGCAAKGFVVVGLYNKGLNDCLLHIFRSVAFQRACS